MLVMVQNLTTDQPKFHNLDTIEVDATLEDLKCILEIESQILVN